ncbi:MAG: DUF58 domain-containing protein [Anaerolineae bacterium]|nr:DUF58 domain-containing protein [Anaerolineae bacterium]
MERGSPAPHVTIRLCSRAPVALAVLLAVLLVLLQLVSPSRAWVILLCGVGGMTLTAYLWARSLTRWVVVARSLRYVWAQVGDLLEERFSLHNQGKWPVLWAEVDDESNLPDYPSGWVVGASGGQTCHWRVSTVCKRRGLFTLGPWTVRMQDPFGLFSVTQRYEQTHSLLVVPPVMELLSVVLPRGVATGRAVARRSATDLALNVSATRHYAPGDPLRRIHWPSSAHHNTLVSKVFDAEVSGDLWIILDLDAGVQAGEEEESTEEYGVILAASLAERMLRQNRAVGLVAYGAQDAYLVPGRGEGQLYRLLRALALVQAGESVPLATVLTEMRAMLGRRTTVVVITPSGDPAWVEALGPLLRRGVAPTAVLLDPASFGGQGDLSPVRGMLAGLGIPAHVIAQGYPFRLSPRTHRQDGTWKFRTTATGRVVVVQRPREAMP